MTTTTSSNIIVSASAGGALVRYRWGGYNRSVWITADDVVKCTNDHIKEVALTDMHYEGIDDDPFTPQEWASVCAKVRGVIG